MRARQSRQSRQSRLALRRVLHPDFAVHVQSNRDSPAIDPAGQRTGNGIEIQCYCAIIACLLINLWTGRKPTKRTFEMISYYFIGLASEEELIAHLEKLKRQDEVKSKKE